MAKRRRRFHHKQPDLYWQIWLLVTLYFVIIALLRFDIPTLYKARQLPVFVHDTASFLTQFGSTAWSLPLAAGLAIFGFIMCRKGKSAKYRYRALSYALNGLYIFLSIALSGLFANFAKRAIGRARPYIFDHYGLLSFHPFYGSALHESFPSGHSVTFGAMAMIAALLHPSYRTIFLILGFFFAMTRVVLGAHFLSDAIAGYGFGMWYAYMSAIVFARHGLLFTRGTPGWPQPYFCVEQH